MLYRIFTENLNTEKIADIVNKYFEGYTLLNGVGYWQGEKENCLIIEIITNNKSDIDKIELIAYAIKKLNHQQAILIQQVNCEANLV